MPTEAITHRQKLQEQAGFTLIELLVVVVVIGILTTIAIPHFFSIRERAWAATVQSDLRNAAIGVETYFTQTLSYPATQAQFDAIVGPIGVPSSLDVTLTWNTAGLPAAYCIEGDHASLAGTPDFVYSSGGGLLPEGSTC